MPMPWRRDKAQEPDWIIDQHTETPYSAFMNAEAKENLVHSVEKYFRTMASQCNECGARPWHPCFTREGDVLITFHLTRSRAWADGSNGPLIYEQQLVATSDLAVLRDVRLPVGHVWEEMPGNPIERPCASRARHLPNGPWMVLAYYPDGYPGNTGGFPSPAADLLRQLETQD